MKVYDINEVTQREIMAHNEKFKLICFVFEPGKGLPNHTHNGLAVIQVVEGEVDMAFINGEHYTLKAGNVLEFDARIEHNVIATVKSKVMITICF